MRFWFFEIRIRHNNIRALFTLKANSKKFLAKNQYFATMELVCSRVIENLIRIIDKSMRYSYRQKDA